MPHTEHKTWAGAARSAPQRQGIALVTVLGMLCLLVVLAVSFAIAMRTERIAGRSYTDTVRVRQLTHAGLARAIGAIDATNQFYLGSPLYTPGGGAPLFSGSATNYIPLGAVGTISAVTNLIGWTNVVTYPTSVGSTAGRIAYLVVDCSGYLDANRSGGGTRSNGVDGSEITLDPAVLVDSVGLPSATFFHSVAGLKQVLGQALKNFVTYSAFPPYKQNLTNDLIMLDVPYATLSSAAYGARIVNALQQCGINTGTQAQDAYSNLLAYANTSTDVPPGGPDNFYTKSVPMLNEVVVSNTVSGSKGNWTHRTYVFYETMYPFPISPPGSYWVEVPAVPTITITPPPDLQAWTTPAPDGPAPAAFTPTANSYPISVFVYKQTSISSNDLIALSGGITATVQLKDAYVHSTTSNQRVDHMPPLSYTLNPNFDGPSGISICEGASVNDPRINWRSTDWVQESDTMGDITLGWQNMPDGPFAVPAERIKMFARNTATPGGGTIANAAELGFLLYDATKPWHTIKLYDDGIAGFPMHPILDYFGTSIQTNAMRRGLVNINSQNTNALAAVFEGTLVQDYPGQTPPVSTVSAADAKLIAAKLASLTTGNAQNSLSLVGRAVSVASVFNTKNYDCERESLVANSYRLLSPRQNLFTILIAAQVTGSSGSVLAEQRAVAVVWRDPYPDANGRHPALVRFFKWLME